MTQYTHSRSVVYVCAQKINLIYIGQGALKWTTSHYSGQDHRRKNVDKVVGESSSEVSSR